MSGERPFPADFEVPRSKVVDYILNVDHPRGGSKARYFLAFGFSPERPDEFVSALVDHVRPRVGGPPDQDPGSPTTLVFEGPIPSPDGRNPWIRSVWVVDPGRETARFITAVPVRGERRPRRGC